MISNAIPNEYNYPSLNMLIFMQKIMYIKFISMYTIELVNKNRWSC